MDRVRRSSITYCVQYFILKESELPAYGAFISQICFSLLISITFPLSDECCFLCLTLWLDGSDKIWLILGDLGNLVTRLPMVRHSGSSRA